MLSEGKLEELVTALRAPSFRQDSAWHHDKVTYSTKPRPLLDEAADTLDALISKLRALRAERDAQKRRADNHWETLRSIRDIAKLGDCERIIQWVNDAGSGYTEAAEKTLAKAIDRAQAAEAELATLRAQAPADPMEAWVQSIPFTPWLWADPARDPTGPERVDLAMERLKAPYVRAQPFTPSQYALVLRWDLGTITHELIWRRAQVEMYQRERAQTPAPVGGEVVEARSVAHGVLLEAAWEAAAWLGAGDTVAEEKLVPAILAADPDQAYARQALSELGFEVPLSPDPTEGGGR